MRAKKSVPVLLAAFVVFAFASACAQAVVTVTPEDMQGWSIETNARGWGALCPWGPSTYENQNLNNNGLNQCPDTPFPYGGNGSFYATCDYFKSTAPIIQNDFTPSTAWLGTDQWNGSPVAGRTLGSITEMNYFSFVSKVPQRVPNSEVEDWAKTTWWNSWQQPISLTLTAESPDKTERRQFWYRPWGYNVVGDDGMMEKGIWQHLNCLQTLGIGNQWYVPECGDTAVKPDAAEFECGSWTALMSSSLAAQFAGSTQTATFSEWTLVATSSDPYPTGWKSPGWSDGTFPVDPNTLIPTPPTDPPGHPNCTATGMPINFWVGARCGKAKVHMQGVYGNWANNSYGFRGQVDYFTLGFDGTSVAYDFEPSATAEPVRVVGSNLKSLGVNTAQSYLNLAPIIQGAYLFNPLSGGPDTHTGSTEMAQKQFLFKVTGKVTYVHQGTYDNNYKMWQNSYFKLDDGSQLEYVDTGGSTSNPRTGPVLDAPLWVFVAPHADGLWVDVGDYVSAYGFVEPMRKKNCGTPLIMWGQAAHAVNYTFP